MAYSTITKPGLHFNTKLYTANASAGHAITGVGFQPDWLWIKNRTSAYNHEAFDAVRGVTKRILPNDADAQTTVSGVTSFDSDGFTLGDAYNSNKDNGNSIVAWAWKANGAGSANTDGSINTTATSVNTTAGFSISKYTGNGSATATIGHGLGVAPSMIICKNLSTATNANWCVYHKDLTTDKNLFLDLNTGEVTPSYGTINAPTNSLINVTKGSGNQTNSAHDFITYCFAEKTGYSKFGSYTGNANNDGTFVYTGFKPAFVMVKPTVTADNWVMMDNKREGYNVDNDFLYANGTNAENDADIIDLVSNGFKMRSSGNTTNRAEKFIYMAFAEEPLVANVGQGIPATAR